MAAVNRLFVRREYSLTRKTIQNQASAAGLEKQSLKEASFAHAQKKAAGKKAKPKGKASEKKKAKPKPEAKSAAKESGLTREVSGFVLMALGIILTLAFLTYHPEDPGLSGGKPGNLIGVLGAYTAHGILQFLGFTAYILPVSALAVGTVLGLRRKIPIGWPTLLGIILMVLTSSVLTDLFFQRAAFFDTGGYLGASLRQFLTPYLGEVGLGIIFMLLFILALVVATSIPPVKTALMISGFFARWLYKGGKVAAKSTVQATKGVGQLGGKLAETITSGKEEEEAVSPADEANKAVEPVRLEECEPLEEAKEEAPPAILHPKRAESELEKEKTQSEEQAQANAEKPSILDKDEKEIVIAVRRSRTIEQQDKASDTEAASEQSEALEAETPSEPPAEGEEAKTKLAKKEAPKTRAKKGENDEGIEIVDRRPKRLSEDDLHQTIIERNRLEEEYELPPINLLDYSEEEIGEINQERLYANAELLTQTLSDYKITGRVKEIHPGPVITMYEFAPSRGTKISKIANLEDDLAMALAALKVRIVAPIPGKSVVGIEVPSDNRETVYLKEIVGHRVFSKSKAPLTLALGKDIFGNPKVANLQKMPHLLIAGATGKGKSVGINAMILSLLFRNTPEEMKLILIDPKRLEFNFYEGVPHLLLPVVTDPKQAALALAWVVKEMENRYDKLSGWGVKNIDSYNRVVQTLEETSIRKGGDIDQVIEELTQSEGGDLRKFAEKLKKNPIPERLPFIVVVIDELADLMMVAGKDVEISIARLAQLARASGIHLIVATQRPSTDVLTGLIKNNFPARMSFQVTQKVDSRTILDQNGAEALLGRGDMLFLLGGKGVERIHGAFVSEEETVRLVNFIKRQRQATYQTDILDRIEEKAEEAKAEAEEYDSEYDKAVAVVCESGKASISLVQRKLRVGYNRAARMIEKMEEEGIVGPPDGTKGRPVYGHRIGN